VFRPALDSSGGRLQAPTPRTPIAKRVSMQRLDPQSHMKGTSWSLGYRHTLYGIPALQRGFSRHTAVKHVLVSGGWLGRAGPDRMASPDTEDPQFPSV